MQRWNRTDPWPTPELEPPHAADRTPLSGPVPPHDYAPRFSGPAPLHSVPRDLEVQLGDHASPRPASEVTTEPREPEEATQSLPPRSDRHEEVAVDTLLRGIEQDAPSRI